MNQEIMEQKLSIYQNIKEQILTRKKLNNWKGEIKMTRTKIAEQTPLLSKNGHTSYMSTNGINNQKPLNRSDSSSSSESIISKESDSLNNLLLDTNSVRAESTISIGNDWEDSVGRYGGITKKRKDENGHW